MESSTEETPDVYWVTYYIPNGEAHVVPHNDTRLHDTNLMCPCCPEVDDEDKCIVHNSFDGREAYEEGTRKFN
jgi:hypothetical protein